MNEVEKYMINKEDLKKYFKGRKIITKKEYMNYLKLVKKFDTLFDTPFYR